MPLQSDALVASPSRMTRVARIVSGSAVCVLIAAVVIVVLALRAGPASADLAARYQSGQQRAQQLQSEISGESQQIQQFQGSISSLQQRLSGVQQSVDVQEQQLRSTTDALTAARGRLTSLRAAFKHDRVALAAQLRAQYESPPPSLVNVVVSAGGFNQLVNGLSDMSKLRRANARTVAALQIAKAQVAVETKHLATVQARRKRSTAAVVVERDNLAQLKLTIVDKQLKVKSARNADTTQLSALKRTLQRQAKKLDAEASQAELVSGGAPVAAPAGCINTPFVAHGGEFGFFQAPGTNYTVNQEPVIAARLDALGKALQLHLIGLSGYRTPEHSVEVGGFADDPHTKGEASDTPGVEGVAESVLEQFCLTRPFPGPAEADHIQEFPLTTG
jgi:peptidoglycan hydrolase CwlO-like protein